MRWQGALEGGRGGRRETGGGGRHLGLIVLRVGGEMGCRCGLTRARPMPSTVSMLECTRAHQRDGTCVPVQGIMEAANMIEGRRGEGPGLLVVRVLTVVSNKLVPLGAKLVPKCGRCLLDVELAQ